LAGDKYQRNGLPGHDRWGKQKGSVYVKDQKIPIMVQRARDTINDNEVSLRSYEKFQQPTNLDEGLLRRVLHGLSCRNYRECVEAIPEAFSLSLSRVSRRYIRASSRKLKEMMQRSLEGHDFVAVVLDGKHFGEDEIIIAVGITMEGKKIILGMIQAATENHKVCKDFLYGLIERGLKYNNGLLCIIDGAKGLQKAINEVFGNKGIVQRCQWHKRENVLSYLPKGMQEQFRNKLQRAYNKETYEQAKKGLQSIRSELKLINESAVRSLDKGFEETPVIHKLGMHTELKRSFRTSNEKVLKYIKVCETN